MQIRRGAVLVALALAAATAMPAPAAPAGTQTKRPRTTTLVDNLYDLLDAGDWSLGEGLVETLELLNGEASRRDVTTRRLTSDDFTIVAEAARAYVASPKDRPRERRIVELLADLLPSPDELRTLAGEGTAPTSSLRGPPRGGEIDCAELWRCPALSPVP